MACHQNARILQCAFVAVIDGTEQLYCKSSYGKKDSNCARIQSCDRSSLSAVKAPTLTCSFYIPLILVVIFFRLFKFGLLCSLHEIVNVTSLSVLTSWKYLMSIQFSSFVMCMKNYHWYGKEILSSTSK
jgi:hypothetical protein